MTSATRLTLLPAGYCTQNEMLVLRSAWRTLRFPALVALIEHPRHGKLLFDTGYTHRFLIGTERFPYRLYRWLTPVFLKPEETVVNQLAERGIEARQINTIILSHFHADHLCGVLDFPQANFIYFADAYASVAGKDGLAALRAAYLPGMLPTDFAARSRPISNAQMTVLSPRYAPFERGIDLFGDGSLIAVPIPGHATGQMGLFVNREEGTAFLAADAVWHSQAFREQILPHPLARLIFANWQDYVDSFNKICQLHRNRPDVQIIPYHCEEIWQQIRRGEDL
ncbi:MAG: MBL fold metallo-hydrolase [Caldilineaceae bacterium]